MASDIFRQILGRAILDPTFRQALLTNPQGILIGLNLPANEAQALQQVTPQQFDALHQSLRSALDAMGDSAFKYKDLQKLGDFLYKEQFIKSDSLIKGESFVKGEEFVKGEDFYKNENFFKYDHFVKMGGNDLVKGEGFIKMLDGILIKDKSFIKMFNATGPGVGSGAPRLNLQGILIGLLLPAILIGLLLFLPAEGLLPMMGLGNIQPTSGELPACPVQTQGGWLLPIGGGHGEPPGPPGNQEPPGPPENALNGDLVNGALGDSVNGDLPLNFQFLLLLNGIRAPMGMDMCATGEHLTSEDGGPETGGGQSTGGQSTGGQTTGGGTDTCECQGTDYVCKKADGSVTYSYNSGQCGGTNVCICRDTTYVCPDSTFAEFNPNCGVGGTSGGGQCQCVCDVPDPQQPGKCLQGHDTCTQAACMP